MNKEVNSVNSNIPSDPKKIRARIRSYERSMLKERQLSGSISDGYGKRFLLGPLYLLLGDLQGGLKSFEWFEQEFPDDSGDPMQYLSWSLILKRNGTLEAASAKLLEAMLKNIYIIPYILGRQVVREDIWHGSNIEDIEYLDYIPPEILDAITDEEKDWIGWEYDSDRTQAIRSKYIELHRDLDDLPVGPQRSRVVEQIFRMMDLDFEGIL